MKSLLPLKCSPASRSLPVWELARCPLVPGPVGISRMVTVDLGPEGLVVELRDENSQAATAGCQLVQAETTALVEDSVVGGVSVQWVAPQQVLWS